MTRVTQSFDFPQDREPAERQMGVFRQPRYDFIKAERHVNKIFWMGSIMHLAHTFNLSKNRLIFPFDTLLFMGIEQSRTY